MSQFKTSVILCIQNFAKNDTENAELASKMLRQQHFMHQRKNLHIPILGRIFSGEPDSDDNHRRAFTLEFFIISLPDFIRDSAERERCPHVKLKKSSEYKDTRSGNLWRNLW